MDKYTGDIEMDTPLLPDLVAERVTENRELSGALANRARRHYRQGTTKLPFREKYALKGLSSVAPNLDGTQAEKK